MDARTIAHAHIQHWQYIEEYIVNSLQCYITLRCRKLVLKCKISCIIDCVEGSVLVHSECYSCSQLVGLWSHHCSNLHPHNLCYHLIPL